MSEKHGKFRVCSRNNYQVSEVCLLKCELLPHRLCELTFGGGLRAVHCPWTLIPHPSLPLSLPLESLLNLFKNPLKISISLRVILEIEVNKVMKTVSDKRRKLNCLLQTIVLDVADSIMRERFLAS